MKERVEKFLRILSIEISDLEEGIEVLILSTGERHSRHEITEYVWTENTALLNHELHILQIIHRQIDALSPGDFDSINSVTAVVRTMLDEREDLPKALYAFLEKKIEKVLRYIDQE